MKALALGLVPAAALMFVAAQPPRAQEAARTEAVPKGALALLFTGEQNGYLTPCGCSKPMLGGIPRLATWLRGYPPASRIQVDNGDLTEAAGRQDELKAETLVEMHSQLGCEAINLGEKDFRLGMAYLRSLEQRFKGALLCANALSEAGEPLFKEFTVVERGAAGAAQKVAIVGLLSAQFAGAVAAAAPEVRLEEPEEALKRLEGRLPADARFRVLLYHGPVDEAAAILRRSPGWTLAVCAHEGSDPREPRQEGEAVLATVGEDGKHAGRAFLFPARAAEVRWEDLGPEHADDPAMAAAKDLYLERVTAEDLLAKTPRVPLKPGEAYAGSAACAPCHAQAHRVWKASGHSRALATLVREKHDRDPECVRCHVVGLDRQGGFVSQDKTPQLAHVGCESCHGPAKAHAANPKRRLARVGQEGCLVCHDPRNSPRFSYQTYWPRIRH